MGANRPADTAASAISHVKLVFPFVIVAALSAAVPAAAQRVAGDSVSPSIVRYTLLRPGDRAALSLDTAPGIMIRESTGCSFFRVRGIIRTGATLIIANAGNLELCLFDTSGRFISRVGRKGAGPAEYSQIETVLPYRGDSVVVLDRTLNRLSVLSAAGAYARSINVAPPRPELGSLSLWAAAGRGTLLLGFSEVTTSPPSREPLLITQQVFALHATGEVATALGRFPVGEHFVQSVPPQRGGTAYWARAFGRRLSLAPYGDGFVAGDGSAGAVTEYAADGSPRASHVLGTSLRPVTPADVAAYRREVMSDPDEANRQVNTKLVEEMPYPATYPAYQRVLAGYDRRIWLQLYPTPGSEARAWTVLDPRTRSAAVVELPSRFRALMVDAAVIWGVCRDADDVESVCAVRYTSR